jgi:Proteasome complex subunit Rpn13 ubiquitin receptor
MSSSRGALFGSGGGGRQSKNLVEFRAGKMTQKGKMVHPDKRKGLLYVYQADDSLIHLCWKDRQSGTVEDVSYLKSMKRNSQLQIFNIRENVCILRK